MLKMALQNQDSHKTITDFRQKRNVNEKFNMSHF